MNMNQNRCVKKGLERCPECHSSNIYKRVRTIWNGKESRKKNRAGILDSMKIEKNVRTYRCHKCKHEFDKPVTI